MSATEKTIGHKIKELREHLQKDQVEFAAMLGVKQPTISGWENGMRLPGSDNIRELVRLAKHCEPPFDLKYADFYTNGD